jgi:excisionase family DNA binding protein
MSTEPEKRRWYSVVQAAQAFGLAPMSVYRAIRRKELEARRVGGRWIIPAHEVEGVGPGNGTDPDLPVDQPATKPRGRPPGSRNRKRTPDDDL